jgi:vacuolar-type H+-ATPase subunit F/Vma7
MSHVLVIVRPALVAGFQLAGVDTYCAEDPETAQELITSWLDARESGLLAIDEALLRGMKPSFLRRLQEAEGLPYLAIPGGRESDAPVSRRRRLAEMLRRTTGYQITFKSEETEDRRS